MAKTNLKIILEKNGITIKKIASQSRVSSSTLKMLVKEKGNVSPRTQVKIVKAINSISSKEVPIKDVFPKADLSNKIIASFVKTGFLPPKPIPKPKPKPGTK